MERHAMKAQERSLTMTELLTALTHAQKEREATLEELKKISESERRRAEVAQSQLVHFEQELDQANKNAGELHRKQKDLEILIENERKSHESSLKKKEEEYNEIISSMREKMALLQKKMKTAEETNSEISNHLARAKNKIKTFTELEENFKADLKSIRDELIKTKEELGNAVKKFEIAESELHITKMQLLKENNINNRLLDELKRMKKDIDGYREEIDRLKKLRDTHKNSLSKQIKELTTFITENGNESYEDNLKEIRTSLSAILKENFVLSNRINDVYTVLTQGDIPLISVSTQTNVGLVEMFSYEKMDKEATCLVMRLREELVTSKNDLIEIKQQNETLRGLVRELKQEKEQKDLIEEEESRVGRLEEAVVYLKQMLKEDEKAATSDISLAEALYGMKKDLDELKDHVIQTTSKPEPEPPDYHFKPFQKSVKLIPPKRQIRY